MAAARVSEERQQELSHEQLVNHMVVVGAEIVSRVADGLRPDEVLTLLDDAEKFLSDVSGKTKKKGEPSLTNAQQYTLQVESDCRSYGDQVGWSGAHQECGRAMQLCEEARLNGG